MVDPFGANGIFTGYPLSTGNCQDPSYTIGNNLNSGCTSPSYPNLPAITGCMTTDEVSTNFPNARLLYQDVLAQFPPGQYYFSITTAHRLPAAPANPITLLDIGFGTNMVFNNFAIPGGVAWVNQEQFFTLNQQQNGFGITVNNPWQHGDFAVDSIIVAQLNISINNIVDWHCHDVGAPVSITGTTTYFGEGVDIQFLQNGQVIATVHANDDGNGNFSYTWPDQSDLIARGLVPGQWYDVRPIILFNNLPPFIGPEFRIGLNNDFRMQRQTSGDVFFNNDQNDLVTMKNTFCSGEEIYFHGELFNGDFSDRYALNVRSRPLGSNQNFSNFQSAGHFFENFDGASREITSLLNLPEGFEYEVYFGVSNPPECIGWTPIIDTIRVIDCCAIGGAIIETPECWDPNNTPQIVRVVLNGPIEESNIRELYTNNPYFDIIGYDIEVQGSLSYLTLYLHVVECNDCEGLMFDFDLILGDCNNLIWLMTPKIPCCSDECEILELNTYWHECVVVNGRKGYQLRMVFDITSNVNINDVLIDIWDTQCFGDFSGLQYYISNGQLIIEGYAATECEFIVDGSILISTDEGCCRETFTISLYDDCDPECLEATAPKIEEILDSEIPGCYTIKISVPAGAGSTIDYTDNTTGNSTTLNVVQSNCPYIDKKGNLAYRSCNVVFITECYECPEEGEMGHGDDLSEDSEYSITLTIGECKYVLTGDFCDFKPVTDPHFPDDEPDDPQDPDDDGNSSRSSTASLDRENGDIFIYPNPITDMRCSISNLAQFEKYDVQIIDVSGMVVEQIFDQTADKQTFEFSNTGIYFAKVIPYSKEPITKRFVVSQ